MLFFQASRETPVTYFKELKYHLLFLQQKLAAGLNDLYYIAINDV